MFKKNNCRCKNRIFFEKYVHRALRIAVGITMSILIAISVAGAPASIIIGNGPAQGDYYINAQNIANNLAITSVAISATSSITIEDNVNLASSPYGTPRYALSLIAPTINLNKNMNMSVLGILYLTATTLNLSDRITSGGREIAPTRVYSTATQVNVLNNAASIQQGIDISSRTAPAIVQVGPGVYNETLSVGKTITLRGNVGTGADGADATAPQIFGTHAGGSVITVTANNVRIEGLHLNARVGDGTMADSVSGISGNGIDKLNVNHNTFEGFPRSAIFIINSTNVIISANYIILHLSSINVTPNSTNLLVGDAQIFTASPKDQYNVDFPATVTWSSSNTTVGTIDEGTANFTALAAGTTMVNATKGSVTGTAVVSVIPTYNISGYVFDNYHAGQEGVLVENGSNTAFTEASGFYSITGLLSGVYNFSYSKAGFSTGYLEITISSTDVLNANRTIYDNVPPASVKDLVNVSYETNYINWTWTEPSDPDFAKVMVYLNGVYKDDVLKGIQYYNATVAPGTYTIGIRTVDTNENINATIVTHTATTILPAIRFINGTVMDSVNKTALSGVTVSANTTLSTNTDATGFYSFAVTPGEYNLTAKFEPAYYANNTIMVSTIGSAVVIKDIELLKKPAGTITGAVTNT